MPICLMMLRATSATVTFSITWSRPRTAIEIDDLVGAAGEARGQVVGLLRLDRACRRAGQHHAVADALDLDVGVRQRLLQRGAHAVEIARDRDVIGRDLLAWRDRRTRCWSGRPRRR